MNKNDIIAELARENAVEKMVKAYLKGKYDQDVADLVQDIYLSLLEKEEEYIVRLHEKNELWYFIMGMVKNNLFSKNSPFYYKYKLWEQKRETFEYNEDKDSQE